MPNSTDSHTADGKRGDDFMFSLFDNVKKSGMNLRSMGEESPWQTVANYVANLERRVCELEDTIEELKKRA